MQTSVIDTGATQQVSRNPQMAPSSSVLQAPASRVHNDTIEPHPEGNSPHHEPTQETTSSLSDYFSEMLSFVQNIPSSLWNFFTGIISYCYGCFSSQDILRSEEEAVNILRPEEEAVRAFLNTRFTGTREQMQTAMLNHFMTLPQKVKEYYLTLISSATIDSATVAVDAAIEIQLKKSVNEAPAAMRLMLHAWLIERQLSACISSSSSTSSSLTEEQLVECSLRFKAVVNSPIQGYGRHKEHILNAFNVLPKEVKESIYIFSIFAILMFDFSEAKKDYSDFNEDLNQFVLETINIVDVAVHAKIQDYIFLNKESVVELTAAWFKERKREAAALRRS